ncbi:Fe-S oxidoreductase [Clostridium putrefaciens]|uniref:Fe-S oxidoreductase n=1 Tax=Clostridium putrefaciens TaxID=99675 RepID=A0A381J540_9CLOT|nr:radical SAM protein [Clostridium putrefaciens]SUY45947.1 Fe-S oxidoreductase [Clostridium putrefaciens]
MEEMKYIYGPVPSRRLGMSLGVSPIHKRTCNYSCIYCQLGRTSSMTNFREMYFDLEEIIGEFDYVIENNISFDIVTIVGEGEPTLYLGLGRLIDEIKKRVSKPVAVITNGSFLYDKMVQQEISKADIILPSMDGYDEESFKKINRPYKKIKYEDVYYGLIEFSKIYKGQLWLEIMFMEGINDSNLALKRYSEILKEIEYDRLYLNTPVRPPAESDINIVSNDRMKYISEILGGISIDLLYSTGFYSEISDDYNAVISIIKRHPMNQFEIESFLNNRQGSDVINIFDRLKLDKEVAIIKYKGYDTYRLS